MSSHPLCPPDLASLIAAVPTSKFAPMLRAYISQAGTIRNFGSYYWQSIKNDKIILAMWNGELSDYRLRLSSEAIINDPITRGKLHHLVSSSQEGTRDVSLSHPQESDPRYKIITRLNIHERLSVVTRKKDRALLSFFLRSEKDGPVTEVQLLKYRELLPVAHELIMLRQSIVGSKAFQFKPGTNASSLKERGILSFEALSKRETQVCDCIIQGQTAAGIALELGIAVTTVNTLKRRAYAKLKITSANQLAAVIINDGTRLV